MKTKRIIQISAGRGPNETHYVVAQVLKILLKEATQEAIEYVVLHTVPGYQNGTIQSVTLMVESHEMEHFIKSWIGTILWIGKSVFRKNHKRKNWYVAVFELTENAIKEIDVDKFQFQAMRSRGAGGQHVNKVSSAIRATDPETGLFVKVSDSRSQHQNKKIAVERLILKINEYQMKQLASSTQNERKNHLEIQRGNPIRVFKGTDFKKEKKTKKYKKQRGQLKKALRNELKN
jgi:peptide chain release factor